jgi:hypothetical protein
VNRESLTPSQLFWNSSGSPEVNSKAKSTKKKMFGRQVTMRLKDGAAAEFNRSGSSHGLEMVGRT